MKKLAPIVVFTYNRIHETSETITALKKNYLASESELFVFSDGPKNEKDTEKIYDVRRFLQTLDGFKNVEIIERQENLGLANSIITGATEIINKYGKIIVLEDDLVTAPNFLDFMNQALDFYSESPKIISISGYTPDLSSIVDYNRDFYLGRRASSLGWGTWRNKWEGIDWEVSKYSEFKKNYRKRFNFFKIGSDMPGMLANQMKGKIDSWAIRWCFHQFQYNLLTVFTTKSKVRHIGINKDATNAAGVTRFDTPLDEGIERNFEFVINPIEDKKITKEFRSKYSIVTRGMAKVREILKI